jgi:hypothetical protein
MDRRSRWLRSGIWVLALFAVPVASGQYIFVTDNAGRVARIDTATQAGTSLGSLSASGFTASQVIGLAYDHAGDRLLILDRSASSVYSMNPTTGVATLLFSTTGVTFQGGAVLNGLLYGINENTQTLAAYSLSGTAQTIGGSALSSHAHSLGVNPFTSTLFFHTSSAGIRVVNTNGSEGSQLVNYTSRGSEDVEYLDNSYLLVDYGSEVYKIDGSSGTESVFLTSTQLSGMGVTGYVSGVAVRFASIPEPEVWALLAAGTAMAAISRLRRRAPMRRVERASKSG